MASTHAACFRPMKHASDALIMLSTHEACFGPTARACSVVMRIQQKRLPPAAGPPARRRFARPLPARQPAESPARGVEDASFPLPCVSVSKWDQRIGFHAVCCQGNEMSCLVAVSLLPSVIVSRIHRSHSHACLLLRGVNALAVSAFQGCPSCTRLAIVRSVWRECPQSDSRCLCSQSVSKLSETSAPLKGEWL